MTGCNRSLHSHTTRPIFWWKQAQELPKQLFFSSWVSFLIILLDFFTDMECTSMEIHYIHHRALFLASPNQLQLQLGCIFCMMSDDQLWPVAVVENFLIWQPVAVAVGPNMAQQLDPTGPHISIYTYIHEEYMCVHRTMWRVQKVIEQVQTWKKENVCS